MNSTESKPGKLFAKYVSQNIFAMIGVSLSFNAKNIIGISIFNFFARSFKFIFSSPPNISPILS